MRWSPARFIPESSRTPAHDDARLWMRFGFFTWEVDVAQAPWMRTSSGTSPVGAGERHVVRLLLSGGGPRGRFVGGGKAVVVASAPAIMQLEFQQSFLFMTLEVPQISSIQSAGRSSCTQSRQSMVVDFLVNRSGNFQGPLLAQCLVREWIHVLRQSWVRLHVVTHFLRQGGTSDPEVCFVLLSSRGLEKRAQSMLQLACRGICTWKFGHYLHEPLVIRSHLFAVGAFRQRIFLEPSSAHSCECSRAGGCRSRREL